MLFALVPLMLVNVGRRKTCPRLHTVLCISLHYTYIVENKIDKRETRLTVTVRKSQLEMFVFNKTISIFYLPSF